MSSAPLNTESDFWNGVCLRMCASLAPERFEGFYWYSIFKSTSIIDQCPENMNILVSEIKVLQMGPRKQNCYFLVNVSSILIKVNWTVSSGIDYITVIYLPKWNRINFFREVTVCPLYDKVCPISMQQLFHLSSRDRCSIWLTCDEGLMDF
jgi:hypothetical protein